MTPTKPERVTIAVELETPNVPNFIRARHGEGLVSVAELDEATLRMIGRAWTEKLVAHAAKKKAERGRRL